MERQYLVGSLTGAVALKNIPNPLPPDATSGWNIQGRFRSNAERNIELYAGTPEYLVVPRWTSG